MPCASILVPMLGRSVNYALIDGMSCPKKPGYLGRPKHRSTKTVTQGRCKYMLYKMIMHWVVAQDKSTVQLLLLSEETQLLPSPHPQPPPQHQAPQLTSFWSLCFTAIQPLPQENHPLIYLPLLAQRVCLVRHCRWRNTHWIPMLCFSNSIIHIPTTLAQAHPPPQVPRPHIPPPHLPWRQCIVIIVIVECCFFFVNDFVYSKYTSLFFCRQIQSTMLYSFFVCLLMYI